MGEERRKYRRFNYKLNCCPTLYCQTARYKVVNISEGGLKIEALSDPDRPFDSMSIINGHIHFSNGIEIQVSGRLVWIIGNDIGIKLNEPISQSILTDEIENFQHEEGQAQVAD